MRVSVGEANGPTHAYRIHGLSPNLDLKKQGEVSHRKWGCSVEDLWGKVATRRREAEVKTERLKAYESAKSEACSCRDDVGTTVAVDGGRHCGSVLEDGGGGARTAARVVDHSCRGGPVRVRTGLRGALVILMSA